MIHGEVSSDAPVIVMKPNVYIESTIISYLTARPSRDLIVAAHQQITVEWWEDVHPQVNGFISPDWI